MKGGKSRLLRSAVGLRVAKGPVPYKWREVSENNHFILAFVLVLVLRLRSKCECHQFKPTSVAIVRGVYISSLTILVV